MSHNDKKSTKSGKSFLASIPDKKPLRQVLKIGGSVIAILLLASQISWDESYRVIKTVSLPYFFLALLFYNISQWISARRLNYFFRAISVHLPASFNLRLYYIGMFFNLLVPGGVGGDGYKAYLIHQKLGASLRSLVSAMIADRLTGVIAIITGLWVLLFFLPAAVHRYWWVGGLLLLIGFIGYYIIFPAFRAQIKATIPLAWAVQLAQLLSVLMILLAVNTHDNIAAYLFIFLLSSLVTVVPFTIGGLGLRELAFLYGARYLELDSELAVGISLIFFIISVISALPGLYFHSTLSNKNWEALWTPDAAVKPIYR